VEYGVTSMVAPLRRVLVRRPATAGDWAGAGWRTPDPAGLLRQHDAFCALLDGLGCEVVVAPAVDGLVDACFTYDPAFTIASGAILLRCPKPVRTAEPDALAPELEAAGVPVVGRLNGTAHADGGDLCWLDGRTLIAGRGYRTNAEAHRQLAELVAADGVELLRADLPHDRGAAHVLHLLSVVSPVADDLAVVFEPLAPVPLLEELDARGVRRILVDPEEYETLGSNVLAVRPGVVVVADGNPRTRRALEAAGCEVHAYDGSELSLKGDGGPTCLTRPLLRRA
jgi:N-dimethylarginine dimethylaminohydrolase